MGLEKGEELRYGDIRDEFNPQRHRIGRQLNTALNIRLVSYVLYGTVPKIFMLLHFNLPYVVALKS